MNGDGADIFYYGVLLILPLSALLARKIPLKSTAKMALAWAGIFAVATVIVSGRDRYRAMWTQVSDRVFGSDQTVSGDTVRIAMADDGHFWATAEIDGQRRRMLIDSGATTTAISAATAKAAGLELEQSPFPAVLDTANGSVVARVSTIKRLSLGGIDAVDLPVVVSPSFGDTDVLGMNFLSRLEG